MSDDIRISLGIEPDDQSANKTKRMVDQVERQFNQFTDEIKQGSKRLAEFFKGPSKNKLEEELKDIQQAADKATKALKETKEAGDKAKSGGGDFTSKSGDVSSAFSTFGGATGFQGFNVVGEVAGVTEQFGKLKEILPGNAAGLASLGVAGIAAGAALGVAAIALKNYSDAAQDQANQLRSAVETTRNINQQIRDGLTSEEAARQLEELNAAMADEIEIRDRLKDSQQQVNDTFTEFGADVLGVFDTRIKELDNQLETSNTSIETMESQTKALEQAMQDGALAANDMANALSDRADKEGELLLLELQAAQASREANESRLQSIENERAVAARKLEILQSKGEAAAANAEKISTLRSQMETLDAKAQILSRAITSAGTTAKDAAKAFDEAGKNISDSARETAKSAGDAVKEGSERVTKELSRTIGFTRKSNKAINKANEETQKSIQDTAKAQMEAAQKAYEEQQRHQQRLMDLTADFHQQREDALFEGDFRALFQLERDYASDIHRMNRDMGGSMAINNNQQDNRNATFNFPQGSMTPSQIQDIVRQEIQTIVIN